jgi:beta-glucosidase-like glycosyl hydrolase
MGAVLSAAPIADAAVEFLRAGGDLCLICHREDFILQAYEALIKTAECDAKFARRVAEASRRVLAFKKKSAKMLRMERSVRASRPPTAAMVEKLSRRLWEFSERVRLEPFSRAADRRRSRS